MSDPERSVRDARQELYEVMDRDLPFEEKAERALDIGERYLGVDHAYLTRIDPESDYWRAVVTTSADEGAVPPGSTADLGTTYCRRAVSDGPVALHDAPEQGWGDDPAFETYGLHCYYGDAIAPGGDLYGTVCFSSEKPREDPFTETETMFVELLARLLEHELERDRVEARLERFEAFASVLSHDLRNPLNVAQGRLDLERRERDTENLAVAARSLDRIGSLIESILEIAREGTAVEETEVVSLSSVAEACWETVEAGDASLVVDGEFEFRADPERVQRVFGNLFRNSVEHGSTAPRSDTHGDSVEHGSTGSRTESDDAVEHGSGGSQAPPDGSVERAGDGAGVTIRIGPLDGGSGFYVEDDGPGIPDDDREAVFEAGYTTNPEGTGLGLAIVGSIVDAHGWEIEVTDADSGGARFEISGVIPA